MNQSLNRMVEFLRKVDATYSGQNEWILVPRPGDSNRYRMVFDETDSEWSLLVYELPNGPNAVLDAYMTIERLDALMTALLIPRKRIEYDA